MPMDFGCLGLPFRWYKFPLWTPPITCFLHAFPACCSLFEVLLFCLHCLPQPCLLLIPHIRAQPCLPLLGFLPWRRLSPPPPMQRRRGGGGGGGLASATKATPTKTVAMAPQSSTRAALPWRCAPWGPCPPPCPKKHGRLWSLLPSVPAVAATTMRTNIGTKLSPLVATEEMHTKRLTHV